MIDIAIERRERTNDKGEKYSQYFRDGVIVGCGCAEALAVTIPKYNHKPCHHVRDTQATQAITGEDVVAHAEDELRGSCCTCGRETKQVICWKCLS
jgi:hypothetical protein